MRFRKKELTLVLILFIFIFQPPFLPVSLIYLLSPYIALLVYKRRRVGLAHVLKTSKIASMSRFFIYMTFYLVIVNALDIIIIGEKGVTITRLRSINQMFFLTLSQFTFIAYLFMQYRKNNYSYNDTMQLMIMAAVLQSLCAVVAFLVPPIRELFMMFGDKNLYSNPFFMERRGYGFSMILIDTFGYGMGLLAGYMLLHNWQNVSTKKIVFSLLLVLFTIAVNARTGILVFLIALGIKIFYRSNVKAIIRGLLPILIVFLFGYIYLPQLLEIGSKSENATISWISTSFLSIIEFAKSDSSSSSVEEFEFLSNFISLPSNSFELFFGSGHHVYDTDQALGFRTDIGYFNMFWELGIVGSAIVILTMFTFMLKPFFMTQNESMKKIAIFNVISYFIVMMKAILIGYNPGVFVNYLATFSLYYYISKEHINDKVQPNV